MIYLFTIYCIRHKENPTICYVGSSRNIKNRIVSHKQNWNKPNYRHYNLKVYQTIRESGGIEMFDFIKLNSFFGERTDAIKKEQEYIETNGTMNTYRSYRTEEEKRLYVNEKTLENYYKQQPKVLQRQKTKYDENPQKFIDRVKECYLKKKEYYQKYARANSRYKKACAELRSISIFEV